MIRREVIIKNTTGLHLRPAGIFCNTASNYKCRIMFEYGGTISNAKSVLSILGACVKKGDSIVLICDGEDEEEGMEAMMREIENGLGE